MPGHRLPVLLAVFVASAFSLSAQIVINEISAAASDRVLRFDPDETPHLGCDAAWYAADYNASWWKTGIGPFGFGYATQGTNLAAEMQNRLATFYLRREFNVTPAQAAAADPLQLVIDYDDGFVAFLNGVEIARRSVGAKPAFTYHDQPAFNKRVAGTAETIAIGAANGLLREGTNLLAIHVLNDSVTQVAGYVGHQPNSTQLRCDARLQLTGASAATLIGAADPWRYFPGAHEPSGGLLDPTDFQTQPVPGPNWTQIDYDDVSWTQAPGALGYDTAPDYLPQLGTNLTQMRTLNMAVFMRREFQLTQAELDGITTLTMTVDWDDGYVLYLNGMEISRNNLGGSPGTFVTFNQAAVGHGAARDGGGNNPALVISISVNKSQLRTGKNVIAGQLHNSDLGSSDLLLDVQFSAAGAAPLTFVTKNSLWRYRIPTSEIGVPAPQPPNPAVPAFHDWIELKNNGAVPVNLSGWALTDERDTPQKWVFPNNVQIAPGGFLVVACSGRDVAAPPPGGFLHTNFSLDADGEYMALHDGAGLLVSQLTGVPDQDFFHTWGIDPVSGEYRFLDRATAGGENAGNAKAGQVAEVEMNRETGFYSAPLEISLTCPTPGAVIRFTTDGSEPTESNGAVYAGPIPGAQPPSDLPVGTILRELWTNVPGANIADFGYNTAPNTASLVNPAQLPLNHGENVANRMRGHVRPTITGSYLFWVAGNDAAELWLSTDSSSDNKERIAFTTVPTTAQAWSTSPSQQSAPINLTAGGKYYVEVLHKDATGTDNCAVAWQPPGSTRVLLGGNNISPAEVPGGTGAPPPFGFCLRARGFAPGMLASDVETRNYALNYDARMRSIPAIFLTGNSGRTFYPPNGVFSVVGGSFPAGSWVPVNAASDYNFCVMHGEAFERPAVFEVLNPGNQMSVRTTLGMRFSASPWSRAQQRHSNLENTAWTGGWQNKPQINVYFRDDFGVSRLRQEGFIPGSHLDEWDTLRLRAGKNDPYNPFIVDELMRRLFRKMDQPSPIGFFANLFINGRFKMYFNPTERPRESFFQEFYGSSSEWDVNVISEWESGDATAYSSMLGFFRQNDFSTLANYQTGLTHWDAENVADYFIINGWGATQDWPHNNFTFVRERAAGAKWRFSMWDAEGAFGIFGQTPTHNTFETNLLVPEVTGRNPPIASDSLASRLTFRRFYQSLEFRLLFADRLQRHFFTPAGCLTAANRQAQFVNLRDTMNPVIQAVWNQSLSEGFWANWGGGAREATFLNQARNLGLWPVTRAPGLSPFGGTVDAGQTVTLSNPNAGGTIYFTVDGSDPRAVGGAVQGTAYAGPLTIAQPVRLMARVQNGTEWSALTEADFAPLPPAILITEINYNPPGPDDETEFIELTNVGGSAASLNGAHFTDGIAFTFGNVSLAAGERIVLVKDAAAFQAAYPGVAVAGVFTGQLSNGGETLTLRDIAENILCTLTYGDSNIEGWPSDPDGEGHSLVLKRPAPGLNLNQSTSWRRSVAAGGNPGGSDAIAFSGLDPQADSDGDGFAALVEYALATNDNDALSSPMLHAGQDGGGLMTVSSLLRDGADDVQVDALESNDLSTWQPATIISDVPAPGALATRTWRCSLPASGDRAFLRLRVNQVP
ncbi:MAG: lamin tail domain-containing protein [Verrucomicrobiales bacterium]